MRKNKWIALLTGILCLLSLTVQVSAVESASLTVQEILDPVEIFLVAHSSGTMTDAFASSAVEDILDGKQAVANAETLYEYVRSKNIQGLKKEPDTSGQILFPALQYGIYLVASPSGEFTPFLVPIPMSVDGQLIYHVEANPKTEETPELPAEPEAPPEESDSRIPQTGFSVYPKYVLMALGAVTTLVGLYEVAQGGQEEDE